MNSLKTVLLLGLMSGILLFGGEALGGVRGLEIGLMMAIGMNFFSYFFSDKIALMSYSAQAVTPADAPEVYARLAPWLVAWPKRWACRCRRCGSSRKNRPTLSPRDAIRNTPRSR